jgi:hypothetical protein
MLKPEKLVGIVNNKTLYFPILSLPSIKNKKNVLQLFLQNHIEKTHKEEKVYRCGDCEGVFNKLSGNKVVVFKKVIQYNYWLQNALAFNKLSGKTVGVFY